jgi:hypothetical protein
MDITLASIKLANVARYMAMAAAHDLPGHSPNWAFGQAVKELGETLPLIGHTMSPLPATEPAKDAA